MARRLVVALAGAAALVGSVAAAYVASRPRVDPAADLYRQASALRAAGDTEGARALLLSIRDRYPESPYAGAAAALVAPPPVDAPEAEPPLTESELRALAQAYRRKAEADPHTPAGRAALYQLAVVLDNAGDVEGAVRAWKTYLERYPTDDRVPEVLYGLGYLHQATLRDTAAARRYYRRVIDEYPGTRYANEAEAQLASMGSAEREAPPPPPPAATIQTPPGEV